jgi:FkbM family methyltransferase
MGIFQNLRFITDHPLNKKRKVAAMRRFVAWQIGSRLAPGPVAIDFVNGAKLLVSPGMTGATGNIYTGLHEFEDMSFVLHALRNHDLFVDVGANIGSYTILAAAAIGARCVAFEPILETYYHLVRNVNLNGISAIVTCENIGIASERGELSFSAGLDTVNHVISATDQGLASASVPVKTLDEALAGSDATIIKIDVEGFETRVVDGAKETLSSPSLLAVIMELNGSGDRYGFDEVSLHERMLAYEFLPFSYSPFDRELISLAGKNAKSGNTIYIKGLDQVRARVKSAPAFVVQGQTV